MCENNSLWRYHCYLLDKTWYFMLENVIKSKMLHLLNGTCWKCNKEQNVTLTVWNMLENVIKSKMLHLLNGTSGLQCCSVEQWRTANPNSASWIKCFLCLQQSSYRMTKRSTNNSHVATEETYVGWFFGWF